MEECGANTTQCLLLLLLHSAQTPPECGSSTITDGRSTFLNPVLYPNPIDSNWSFLFRALTAQPNAAHYALAMFSIPHFRNSVMSSPDTTFSLVTQNVDELSRKALREIHSKYKEQIGNPSQPEPPPRELLEIHGSLFKLSCTECKHVEKNYNSPICPSLKGTEDVYEKASSKPEPDIPIDELPQCKACGALGRPGVVWFGEAAPSVILMNIIARESDFCLVVGTSSKVRHGFSEIVGLK